MSHVTDQDLRKLVAGTLDPPSRRQLFAHLLSGCPACRAKTDPLTRLLEGKDNAPPTSLPAPAESAYEGVLGRLLSRARGVEERLRRERAACGRFLAAVERPLRLSPEEILDRLEAEGLSPRAGVEALLTLSHEERARNPQRMLGLALAARITVDNLPCSEHAALYSPTEIADLQARTWGELANAYRVNERQPEAEQALIQAATARAAGSGDLMVLARLFDVEASLRTDQRRFGHSYRLLDLVYSLYQQVGETHLAGRALISKGAGFHYDGRYPEAVTLLRRALTLLDSDRDPQLLANGRQALLSSMAANGEFVEAAALLLQSGLRETFADEPLSLLKVRWLEGRIFAGLGKLGRAATVLGETRRAFLDADLDYEGALVGLELAGVLLQQSRFEEVETLAEEALETFEILDIGREALKAVGCLREACAAREATAALVRRVTLFLERLDRRPDLRFRV
jgi:tetratricopeptide (TPR) repeat protein